jgi:hypothetical protein
MVRLPAPLATLKLTLLKIDVEPLTQSQVHQMLQKFKEKYNTKFSNQDQTTAEHHSMIGAEQ